MFGRLAVTAIAASVLYASAAGAVTVVNPVALSGSLVLDTLQAGDNLTNNGPFASNGTNRIAYLLDEGVNGGSGERTFLLHYDRSGTIFSTGRVRGSFDFMLAPGDTFASVYSTSAQLRNSDDLTNGVSYQRCLACLGIGATIFRGLEPSNVPIFGDVITITPGQNVAASLYTVTYDLTNDGATLDEVRFGFTSAVVPEPATWALMISGFGVAGAALRRRRAPVRA